MISLFHQPLVFDGLYLSVFSALTLCAFLNRLLIFFFIPNCTSSSTYQLFLSQVKELTEQFPAATPLAFVLKQFLADRSLDQSYSGGLSSYCLVSVVALIIFFELACSMTKEPEQTC